MVCKAYRAAEDMAAQINVINSRYDDSKERSAAAHFGVPFEPTMPMMSQEEFIEAEAKVFLGLLLKQEEAKEKAEYANSK